MSWDSYLPSVIGAGESIVEVAICGTEPESVWAKTPNFGDITTEEIKALAGSSSSLQARGPNISGNKYMLVRDDTANEQSFSMIFSRRVNGVEHSVCVGRTNKALVIALGKPEVKGNALVKNVFNVVKYMRDTGN